MRGDLTNTMSQKKKKKSEWGWDLNYVFKKSHQDHGFTSSNEFSCQSNEEGNRVEEKVAFSSSSSSSSSSEWPSIPANPISRCSLATCSKKSASSLLSLSFLLMLLFALLCQFAIRSAKAVRLAGSISFSLLSRSCCLLLAAAVEVVVGNGVVVVVVGKGVLMVGVKKAGL